MKFRYIFIPTILLTILVVGICFYYYKLNLLSLDHVYMIVYTSYCLSLIVFFGIYLCAYKASKAIAEEQNKYISNHIIINLRNYIDDCFAAHDALTKDIVKYESLGNLRELKKLILILNEKDEQRTKAITNLLVNEAIERLDNVLICLRGNDVEEKNVENKE